MSPATTPAPLRSDRWAVLALAVAARTANVAQFQSVGATGPALLAAPSLCIAYGGLGALAAWPLGIALALMLHPVVAEAASWAYAMLEERSVVERTST